jgi:hypothetical protein
VHIPRLSVSCDVLSTRTVGVAFHPKGAVPSAGCPVCPKDLPSSRQQELFAIWGLNPGEYDDIIPDSWLRCPPNRLETQDVEMDGLRVDWCP